MIEIIGDIWNYLDSANAICIPTNGIVKKSDGKAVMGAGLALQALKICPIADEALGLSLQRYGQRVGIIGHYNSCYLVAFPTKVHWKDPSILSLIETSAQRLVVFSNVMSWKAIVLPRVGCGLGQLQWDDVKVILEKYFDNRFIIVSQK